MSTQIDIEQKVREIRRKIIKAMLSLPNYIVAQTYPEGMAIGTFGTRSGLLLPTRSLTVALGDKDGNIIRTFVLAPFKPTEISSERVNEALIELHDKIKDIAIPYVAIVNNNEYKRVAKAKELTCMKFSVNKEDMYVSMFPAGHEPQFPLEIIAHGTLVYDKLEEVYELVIIVGNIGYKTTDGKYVYWRGMVIHLGILGENKVTIRTVNGAFGYIDDRLVTFLALTGAFSVTAKVASFTWC